MSYVRFGEEDSSVYVFTSQEGLECCGCSLISRHWVAEPERTLGGYFAQDDPSETNVFHSNGDMIAHLVRHRSVGHTVPEYVFERLRDPEDAAENERIWNEEDE